VKPFFFGRASRPLFGLYQPPRASGQAASAVERERAVLLAYPGAPEYNNAHWAFRKLTGMLARAGFHVLRFDWSSTGDSSGDSKDGRPAAWVEDIGAAAKELRHLSGAPTIDVVAMRLGAAIAALASIEGDAVRAQRLVLWEPVVRGTTYVKDLEDQNARESFQLLHRTPPRDELVGFPFPDELRRAILEIALDRTPPVAAREVAIFVGKEHDDHRALQGALEAGGRKVSFHVVPEDASVTNAGAREAALLANRVLTAMTEHLAS
jgi:pimeloyl-ACP methyl ester carboxylesterase